jgi:steroid 5-alpha reductase family enzyme
MSASQSGKSQEALFYFASTLLSVLFGALMAWTGSQGSVMGPCASLFTLCILVAFVIQWLAFIPAYLYQTEKYYDFTGMLSYLAVTLLAWSFGPADARAGLVALLVSIWTLRLGNFLFLRIRRDGSDGRFDSIKVNFWKFLLTWTLQGLWVSFTLAAGLAAMTTAHVVSLGYLELIGLGIWLVGFTIEVVADEQKRRHRKDPSQQGQFIQSGLWSWSRHPNYCGEIILWAGIALIALPALQGWQYLTLISPLFVYILLSYISGINLLEERADARWEQDPAYQAYKAKTSCLWLRPPSKE